MPFKEVTGDLFEYLKQEKNVDAICCTTNMMVKASGELVMGAGIAKAFATEYPNLAKKFGDIVKYWNGLRHHTPVSIVTGYKDPYIIFFPTKYDWRNPSPITLVEKSLQELVKLIDGWKMKKVILPKPGCSNGGLDWQVAVKPLCEKYLDERFVIISK